MHARPPESLPDELRRCYPSLRGMPQALPAGPGDRGLRLLDAPPGTRLFAAGQDCEGFPLVLGGEIQVAHNSSDGRCLELYRVGEGQVCLVSAAGLLSRRPLGAQGTATRDTRLALVPPGVFADWNEHAPFRQFVFGVFAERLVDLIAVVDAVAFQRLDRRLAEYLVKAGPHLHVTHQHLADELGTVREMITRLLNRFEGMGLLTLGREHIAVADVAGLRAVAGGRSTAR
jgi:CRP/FNR family transcriptional regulator, anaerobic regulatory protein